ncbi:MAG: membrane protein insertase YidC [bacterium]|nr:MAG: membrane protein insertase YidC [bacterium]
MDDQGKRLLLALVISLAFLFVYQNFLMPPGPPPAEEAAEESPAPQPLDTQTAEPSGEAAPAATLEPIAEEAERLITVRTPRYVATLSNRGGAIRSFALEQYREDIKDPESHVQMVRTVGEERALPLSAEFTAAGGPLGFAGALFRPDGRDLDLAEGQTGQVVYRYRTPEGLEMVKTLTFSGDDYRVQASVRVLNRSGDPLGGRLTIAWAPGLEPTADAGASRRSKASRYGYMGAMYLDGGKTTKIKGAKLEGSQSFEGQLSWVASMDMYFVAALMPGDGISGAMARKGSGDRVEVGLYSQLRLPPDSAATVSGSAYIGPKDMAELKKVDPALARTIELGIFGFIAKPLLDLLNFFHRYVGNYGVAIIILSTLIKIVFIPFSTISHRSMKKTQKLQPQINQLKDRYKKDREKLNQEIMKLYQENKVNPMGGCLPILVQIPVFFALYRARLGAIELRHAPFYFWIQDLSAKDPLFITPVIMGATMVLQQKMTPTAVDPRQEKIMMFLPVVFTALFLSFPSGLVIYWTVNNVLTIAHQYFLNKGGEKGAPEAAEPRKGKKKR